MTDQHFVVVAVTPFDLIWTTSAIFGHLSLNNTPTQRNGDPCTDMENQLKSHFACLLCRVHIKLYLAEMSCSHGTCEGALTPTLLQRTATWTFYSMKSAQPVHAKSHCRENGTGKFTDIMIHVPGSYDIRLDTLSQSWRSDQF